MNKSNNDPNLSRDEAALLELVQNGELRNWIQKNAGLQADTKDFMNAVCQILSGMQQKGLIQGFTSASTGGQLMPVVKSVRLATSLGAGSVAAL